MIGISPGTRSIGIAVIKDGSLEDWGVKLFREKWSDEKLNKILRILEAYMLRYNISTLAIKRSHVARTSEGLDKIYYGILLCANRLKIKCQSFTIEELKRRCNGASAKHSLMSYINQNYPEVERTITLKNSNFNYHMKTIEAVALAHILSK